MKQRMIYIAGPYTSKATGYRTQLYEQGMRANVITRYAALLMEQHGVAVFSPVTHGHAIWMASGCELGRDAAAWAAVNDPIMALCNEIHVLRLRGWDASVGVKREIDYFAGRGIAPQWVDVPLEFYKHARERLACHPLESVA